MASSLSLPASSSSSRLSSRSSHRRLRLIAVDSSPSSPSPSPSFYCCLRFLHHLIAVFNFAIGSSPSSSLPISSSVAYNDGTIGSRKKLQRGA
ncbi:Uncharacterized protein APZ42_034430 [Daphnia magna]|uniref:Uncharacterized protein n=1 Tax=Daphnia magna TaxID=35525 RepID=A0A164K682_9CRUS|nr:Uncharacterized protein APZ42_034430 [Daphnia magna]